MKEKYESIQAEIIKFETPDVICTSGGGSTEPTVPAQCQEIWATIWYF